MTGARRQVLPLGCRRVGNSARSTRHRLTRGPSSMSELRQHAATASSAAAGRRVRAASYGTAAPVAPVAVVDPARRRLHRRLPRRDLVPSASSASSASRGRRRPASTARRRPPAPAATSCSALVVGLAEPWRSSSTTGGSSAAAATSLGKRALDLRLLGEQTGQPVGALMAFVRDIAHVVDGLTAASATCSRRGTPRSPDARGRDRQAVVVKA